MWEFSQIGDPHLETLVHERYILKYRNIPKNHTTKVFTIGMKFYFKLFAANSLDADYPQTGGCLRELRLENNVRCLSFDTTRCELEHKIDRCNVAPNYQMYATSNLECRLVTGDDDGFLVFWDMKVLTHSC